MTSLIERVEVGSADQQRELLIEAVFTLNKIGTDWANEAIFQLFIGQGGNPHGENFERWKRHAIAAALKAKGTDDAG